MTGGRLQYVYPGVAGMQLHRPEAPGGASTPLGAAGMACIIVYMCVQLLIELLIGQV